MFDRSEHAPGEGFPRKYRLGANRNYRYVYRRGKTVSAGHFTLVYMKAKDLKIGFSVSKKVGNAVTRNRIRRWLREDIRRIRPLIKCGRYIVIARPTASAASHETVSGNVQTLLARAKALKEGA